MSNRFLSVRRVTGAWAVDELWQLVLARRCGRLPNPCSPVETAAVRPVLSDLGWQLNWTRSMRPFARRRNHDV